MAKLDIPATSTQKSVSAALLALAGALFGAVLGALPTIFSLADETGDRIGFWTCTIILLLLTSSMIFGGRGYAYGPNRTGFRNRFNLQATSGLIAILLTAALGAVIYHYPAPEPETIVFERVSDLESRIEDMTEQLNLQQTEVQDNVVLLNELRDVVSSLQRINEELGGRLDQLENDSSNR